MKKITYFLFFILTLSISSTSYVKANTTDKVLIDAGAIAVVAGGAIFLSTTLPKVIKYYSNHPNEFEGYLQSTNKNKENIENEIKKKLLKSKSEDEYLKYKKLADTIGMSDIPPYEKHDPLSKLKTLHLPQFIENAKDKILEHPITETDEPYLITSPYGEKIDTRLEFPIEQPKSWNEYVLLKQNSVELAKNMINANNPRPTRSVAHHVIPATMKDSSPAIAKMKSYGIDMNDAENGIWLPQPNKANAPSGAVGLIHSGVHPKVYAQAVNRRILLTQVDPKDPITSKANIVKELDKIKSELYNAPQNGQNWYNVIK